MGKTRCERKPGSEPALVEAEEALHVRQPQAGSTRAAQAGRSKATDGVSVQ